MLLQHWFNVWCSYKVLYYIDYLVMYLQNEQSICKLSIVTAEKWLQVNLVVCWKWRLSCTIDDRLQNHISSLDAAVHTHIHAPCVTYLQWCTHTQCTTWIQPGIILSSIIRIWPNICLKYSRIWVILNFQLKST